MEKVSPGYETPALIDLVKQSSAAVGRFAKDAGVPQCYFSHDSAIAISCDGHSLIMVLEMLIRQTEELKMALEKHLQDHAE